MSAQLLAGEIRNRIVEVRKVKFAEIANHPRNPKRHGENQRKAFRGSVAELGFVSVPLAYHSDRANGALVWADGHLRGSEVADYVGDVAILDIDDAEADKLLLYADPIAAMAEYESQQLDGLLRDISTTDQALTAMLAGMAKEAGLYPDKPPIADPGPQIDKAEELRQKWGVESGDLWQLGNHRLICGDCTDKTTVERLMQGEKADTVITDPPYGVDFDTDYTKIHGGNFGTQKRNNHPKIHGDDKEFDPSHLMGFKNVVLWGANCYPQYLTPGAFLVWDKRNSSGQTLFSDAEIGWLNKGHGCYIFAHKWDGLNRESERGEHYHPTQKPVALWGWVIAEHVKDASIIYDPYCGVGGVIIACEQLSRQCRAVEISPAYAAVALERWATATNTQPVRVEA